MLPNFDRNKLLEHIPEIDFGAHSPPASALQPYSRYYGLNFEDKYPHINHSLGYFQVLGGKVVTHTYQHIDPEKNTQGTVFLFHGYFDHSGLYTHLIEHILLTGFCVVIYDLLGHGLSTGPQATIDDFDEYLETLNICLQLSKGHLPSPWHAIAQSTGGAILMDFLLTLESSHFDNPFEETILLAPLFHPTNWKKNRVIYYFSRSFTRMVKRDFVPNSHDENFSDFIRHHDPLQSLHTKVTWVGALNKWITKMEGHPPCQFSTCVIQGTDDGTVDAETNIAFIKEKFCQPSIHYIQDARHHLVNESEEYRKAVFALIEKQLVKK